MYIYFTQRLGRRHVFQNLPSFNKKWKGTFVKVNCRIDKKLAYRTTQLGKITFPLRWKQMEKKNYEKELEDLSFKDQTVVDIISELYKKDSQDIQIIMG